MKRKFLIHTALLMFALLFAGLQIVIAADVISVQAQVAKQEVAVGEPFLLQIKIEGDDSPSEPDLSGLHDFTVESKGGGQNNRESITIINGKMNRISEHGYVFNYALTPKRDGILTIPAIAITAAGNNLLTQPITIKVSKPEQTDGYELDALSSLLEPLIIVIIGVMVGAMVIAMYLPIFKMAAVL